MNRKERREKGIKGKEPVYNLRECDIKAMKEKATKDGVDLAFFLMLAIPVMVIHDKFGEFMRKSGREEKFADHCLKLYQLYDQGYVSLDDLRQCLFEETGLRMENLKP